MVKKVLSLALVTVLVCATVELPTKASGHVSQIKSRGVINYEDKVIFDSSDLIYLEQEIWKTEDQIEACKVLAAECAEVCK